MLIGAVALATSVAAQPAPPPAGVTRTVVAATKLLTVTEAPLYFRAVSVPLPPGGKSHFSAVDGILYQVSGSTEITFDKQTTTLNSGDGFVHCRREKVDANGRQRSSFGISAFLPRPGC